jgi:hypothetical protein
VQASSRPSRRPPQQSRHHSKPPPTAMRTAFLRALAHWVERHSDTEAKVAIHTGTVNAAELVRIVIALGLIRRRSAGG